MKKNGFTLAESLVTLLVVGVIAAVTLPTLLLNVEKKKVGPAVMKAVNTLETSSSLAMRMKDVRKLSDYTNKTKHTLIGDILVEHTHLTRVPNNVNYNFGELKVTGDAYATKDGIVFYDSGLVAGVGTFNKKFSGNAYIIIIDINGSRSPNSLGRDVFELFVDDKGLVVPYGSYLWNSYSSNDKTWETGCKSITISDKSKPSDPRTCAGAIVDNGGRVLYNYEDL